MSVSMKEPLRNESPPIRIDRNGVWYFQDVEMTRFEIVRYFYDHLQRDANGQYRIEIADDQCLVQVDDVPYVVQGISEQSPDANGRQGMVISLSDGTREELNPGTLRIGEGNVPYCRIKQGKHEARFTRQAYYQLAKYIEHDAKNDRYFMNLDGSLYDLTEIQSTVNGGPYVTGSDC